MDYTIVRLTAEVATGNVIEALWMLSHTVGLRSAYRSGTVRVPLIPTPVQFATVTEAQAVLVVKDVLGATYMADLEAGVLAELADAATLEMGTPWGQVPPPPPPPEPLGAPLPVVLAPEPIGDTVPIDPPIVVPVDTPALTLPPPVVTPSPMPPDLPPFVPPPAPVPQPP